jgi:sugar phosphate isomerase/epimerase
MDSPNRREFLSTLAVAGAGLPMMGAEGTKWAGTSSENPSKEAEQTINVFSKHLQFLDYAPMAETAAEIGFDGVDLTVRDREGAHVLPEDVEEDLPRAVNVIREAGLKANMMATDLTDAQAPRTQTVLKTASEVGIRYYRMGKLSYEEEMSVRDTLQAYKTPMHRLAMVNEKYGIHGDYQNHEGTQVGGPIWDLWMLLEGLNPEWIGSQYDIRHATVEGAHSWPLGLNLITPYIGTLTIKDFEWRKGEDGWEVKNVPLGEGMVDFASFFERLEENEIRAPMSMHFEYEMVDEEDDMSQEERRQKIMQAMRRDLTQLRTLLEDAGR